MYVIIACPALVRTEEMRLAMKNKRLEFFQHYHDEEILDIYECKDFLEITTKRGTFRIREIALGKFSITER